MSKWLSTQKLSTKIVVYLLYVNIRVVIFIIVTKHIIIISGN